MLVGPKGWNEDLGAPPRAARRTGCARSGFVPDDDKRALYAGAEVFCLPSLREGFGLPVLEAMAQGTPVLATLGDVDG